MDLTNDRTFQRLRYQVKPVEGFAVWVLKAFTSAMTLPEPVRAFFSYFPLYTHPAIRPLSLYPSKIPTLWISPPRRSSNLSTDVDCLKWQAYLALRGVTDIAVRWDISPEGAIDGKLPNLQVPLPVGKGELLATHSIPAWVNKRLGVAVDSFEGYKDEASRDESYAWIALLEGSVHAALVCLSHRSVPSTECDKLSFTWAAGVPATDENLHVINLSRIQDNSLHRDSNKSTSAPFLGI